MRRCGQTAAPGPVARAGNDISAAAAFSSDAAGDTRCFTLLQWTPAGWRAAAEHVTNNSQTRRNWLGRPGVGLSSKARCPSNNVCLLPSPITTRHLDHRSPLRCTFQNPIFNICFLPATRLILLHGQIYALGPGVISGKSIYAPVGRALLRSASLECDFGAWDVEAKLAALAQNTQHTLPTSHNTPWCPPFLRPSPHPPLPVYNCSWTSTPSTQLPRISRSKGSSPSRPSRHRRCRIPESVAEQPAFASIDRGFACRTAHAHCGS